MKILMVCLGNICRSPLAEGILRGKLPANFMIDSAGTISLHEGEHPDKRAIETAKNHGIDISGQKSRPITVRDLQNFDHIYCMDLSVFEDVISLAQNEEQRKKISLFLEAAGEYGQNTDVPDPYWSGMDGFEKVFLLLEESCESIKTKLLTHNS